MTIVYGTLLLIKTTMHVIRITPICSHLVIMNIVQSPKIC